MSSPEWKEIFDQFNQAHDAIKRTVSILTDRTSFPESAQTTALHASLKEKKQQIAELKARNPHDYQALAEKLDEIVKLQDQLIFFPSGLSGAATPANATQSPDRREGPSE